MTAANTARYLFIIVFFASSIASLTKEEDPCQGAGAMHGAKCAEQKATKANEELEVAYREALARAKEEDKRSGPAMNHQASLKTSQSAWLNHRIHHCRLAAQATGASGGWVGVHEVNCVATLNTERRDFLNSLWAG